MNSGGGPGIAGRAGLSIGQAVRHGVVFKFKNWPMKSDTLLENIADLFELLEVRHVHYLLVGGVALLQYVTGRNTEDIDLIMPFSALQKLPEIQITGREPYFARGQFNDLRLDLLLTNNPLFRKVQHHYATPRPFVEREIPCATVEGLLLLKLYALPSLYRQDDFARVGLYENDIATLLNDYQPPLEPLWGELAAHLGAGDLAALRKIVAEIEQRIARFRRGFE